ATRRARDTLSPQSVYARFARQRRALFLAARVRSFSGLHLRAKELPNAINAEQALAASLAASSQRHALDVSAVVQLVQQTSADREAPFNALRVQKFWVLPRDMSRCRVNRG